jgi:biopolymer transport protein TolQ
MFVNTYLGTNPLIEAYAQSDFLGKLIFISLLALSIGSWVLIIHKGWMTYSARKYSTQFYRSFEQKRKDPLNVECEEEAKRNSPNPFLTLYFVLKKHSLDILKKNQQFGRQSANTQQIEGLSYMSPSDIDFVHSHLMASVASQIKHLEKNLFFLSTIVSLAPFLGLLGTVWGILMTFTQLQAHNGSSHNMVLGGISLALATTVLGLIDAIPALIGYNYLKNSVRDFQTDMEGFSNDLLASVEMYYRKVDIV